MALSLLDLFPEPKDLLALEPEELGAVLVEIIPGVSQSSGFLIQNVLNQVFLLHDGGYRPDAQNSVALAIAEAMSWLCTQGLLVKTPGQPADWYQLTRRGRTLKTRASVEAYRMASTLPVGLLGEPLASKVYALFARGDYAVAVFQAFKEVEVAVRKAGDYEDYMVGIQLMRAAFDPTKGPLADKLVVKSEREATAHLFAAAIGHAKNPPSHRDVRMNRVDAARLIVFASHLLEIVAIRELLG